MPGKGASVNVIVLPVYVYASVVPLICNVPLRNIKKLSDAGSTCVLPPDCVVNVVSVPSKVTLPTLIWKSGVLDLVLVTLLRLPAPPAVVPTAVVTIPHYVVIVDAISVQSLVSYTLFPLSLVIVRSLICLPLVPAFVVTVMLRMI